MEYKVTGITVDGKRFKAIRTNNQMYAYGINLYRGTVWGRNEGGNWTKLKTVWN